jgi:hypothetical protein
MLEQVGNFVKINDQLIPACNIQVKNVPGYVTWPDGQIVWAGVYFEIMFEDGSLWIVDQLYKSGPIHVLQTPRFGYNKLVAPPERFYEEDTWDNFLFSYNLEVSCTRVWESII